MATKNPPAKKPIKASPTSSLPQQPLSPKFLASLAIIILLGTSLFFFAKRYRGLIIAGIVNKTPITRWQLNNVLSNRYGEAVLEELVNNELLTQEATKQGISISESDISTERSKLVENLGGEEKLSSALLQYGLSESDLTDQIRLRLLQERLSTKLFDITITDEQVQEHFDTNSSLYKDQKLTDVKDEIKTNLEQQQLQQEFFAWFDQLKQSSQIVSYLD